MLIESTDHRENWTTIGVSTDIIDASWRALVDSIEYKLVREQERRAAVDQLRHHAVRVDRVLDEDHDVVGAAARQDRLRDRLDLLLYGRRRVVSIVDVVQHDQIGPVVVELDAARAGVEDAGDCLHVHVGLGLCP